jgi:antirestriction protein ArdC
MITMARTHRKPTTAQRAAAKDRRDGIMKDLSEGIARLTNSDEWRRYLDVQARFHRYSFPNVMLIMLQCPAATRVASYRRWQEMKRQVRKGEHGIRVWAPSTRKVAEATPNGAEDDQHEEVTGFVLVPVFDISQTDGEPLPEVVHLLEGEDPAGIFGRLAAVAEGMGFKVTTSPEIPGHPGANGLCEYRDDGRTVITVASNRSPLQMIKSLAHEITHAILHCGSELPRGRKELEAESGAYVVCRHLGLDTSEYSFGYVAVWQNGDADAAQEAIKASGRAISRASRKILAALDAEYEPQADAA